MELRKIIGNAFFIVMGFLSGCGFDDEPAELPAPKIEIVRVETSKPEVPVVKAEEKISFEGLDDFASLGIPEGWGDDE